MKQKQLQYNSRCVSAQRCDGCDSQLLPPPMSAQTLQLKHGSTNKNKEKHLG